MWPKIVHSQGVTYRARRSWPVCLAVAAAVCAVAMPLDMYLILACHWWLHRDSAAGSFDESAVFLAFTKVIMVLIMTFLFGLSYGLSRFAYWKLRWQRVEPGTCVRCDYNLTGNVTGICPECGEPISCTGSGERAS